jgi:hypothetical protein
MRQDQLIVELQRSLRTDAQLFFVNLGVAPRPLYDWHCAVFPGRREATRGRPTIGDSAWRMRLQPPAKPIDDRWAVDGPEAARVAGAWIVEQLQSGALARLRALADRDSLLAELGLAATAVLRAALAADDGPSEELEQLLAGLSPEWAQRETFIAWARGYALQEDVSRS